ncbi:MAG: glycoside hydrolase family 27 protein [Bacteroidetes bacterium]|nr:glycoside hydrolase family 27 protein [Bacteroidota bacterium]
MKTFSLILLLTVQITVYAQYPELAQTPPMGWNSWNAFGLDINSEIVKAVADSMVSKGLAAAGYQYIVIDDGWQIGREKTGKIIADSIRFPEGIKYLADYVHSKGLKFGIYTCCGTKTCGGRPGSFGYESIDAQTYAEWGVDFIKEDWCFTDGLDTRTQYKIMSDAIRATGRPMLLSLCEWGTTSPWEWGKGIGAMWRTTNDIQDCFDCVRNWGGMGFVPILEKNINLAPYAGPGHWNDPDMLEVGNKALSPIECRSHFAMWCMLAAPLIAGNNISTMNDTIRDILTAPEIIAIDQDPLGIQGTRIRNNAGLQVWQKQLHDGSIAVALFNITKSKARMSVTLEEIGFQKGIASSVRDLWNRKDLPAITDIFKTEVESHGVVVVKIKGKKGIASKLKFENSSIKINKGNHQLIQLTVLPSTTPLTVVSTDENILSVSLAGVNLYKISALQEGNCTLKASTTDGTLSTICNVHIVPSNIPSPWKCDDINNNKASFVYEKGVFTIEGGGGDIWGASDQFAFLYRKTEKDNIISARVISQTNTDPWAKSGLMFRENTAPNSAFVMLCATPGNGISLQWRETTGGTCNKKDLGAVSLPVYFRLSKIGSKFLAYRSIDGKQWNTIGDIKLNNAFPEKYLSGLEVAAHNINMLNISKFDHVKVEPIVEK